MPVDNEFLGWIGVHRVSAWDVRYRSAWPQVEDTPVMMGHRFIQNFGDCRSEISQSDSWIWFYDLKKSAGDEEIFKNLPQRGATPLEVIWTLCSFQKDGEEGLLRVDAATNIFYCLSPHVGMCCVYLRFAVDRGWSIRSYPITSDSQWIVCGQRVFGSVE